MGDLRHAKKSGPGDDDRRGARAGGRRKRGTPSSDGGVLGDLARRKGTAGERGDDGGRAVEAAWNREGRQDPPRRAARLAADFANTDRRAVAEQAGPLLGAAASEAVRRAAVGAAVGDRHDPRAERLEVAPAFRRRQVEDDRLRRSRSRARTSSAAAGGALEERTREHPAARGPPRTPPLRSNAAGILWLSAKGGLDHGVGGRTPQEMAAKTKRPKPMKDNADNVLSVVRRDLDGDCRLPVYTLRVRKSA